VRLGSRVIMLFSRLPRLREYQMNRVGFVVKIIWRNPKRTKERPREEYPSSTKAGWRQNTWYNFSIAARHVWESSELILSFE
jgi:hypothetical protein